MTFTNAVQKEQAESSLQVRTQHFNEETVMYVDKRRKEG